MEGAAGYWDHREDTDYFSQAGALFRLMNPTQRQALFDNTARAMKGVSQTVRARHIDNCNQADPEYGAGVAAALAKLAG